MIWNQANIPFSTVYGADDSGNQEIRLSAIYYDAEVIRMVISSQRLHDFDWSLTIPLYLLYQKV